MINQNTALVTVYFIMFVQEYEIAVLALKGRRFLENCWKFFGKLFEDC
jgi:hypothetical protein